jgi:hypothetical protein
LIRGTAASDTARLELEPRFAIGKKSSTISFRT